MDLLDLADIYDNLEKTLPGATGGAWDARDPLIPELKSRSWQRRKAAVEDPNAKIHHVLVGLKDKDERVAAAAARSPLLDPEHLRLVMNSVSPLVRREALSNPKLPLDLVDRALADPEIAHRDLANLFQNPALQHPQITKALAIAKGRGADSGYSGFLETALNHPGYDKSLLSEQTEKALATDDTDFLNAVAESGNLSPDVISKIIARGPIDKEYGQATDHLDHLKRNPNLTSDHVLQMLQNKEMPNQVIREVTDPDNEQTRARLTPQIIGFMFNPQDQEEYQRLHQIYYYNSGDFIKNPAWWTPENTQNAINNKFNGDDEVENIVGLHATPEHALSILRNYVPSKDENGALEFNNMHLVRGAADRLAKEDILPEHKQESADAIGNMLKTYGNDSGYRETLAEKVLENPMARPEHIDAIARGSDPQYGATNSAWSDPRLPPETLQWGATHTDPQFRTAAAKHENLPLPQAQQLLRDTVDPRIRRLIINKQAHRLTPDDWQHVFDSPDLFPPYWLESPFGYETKPPSPEAYYAGLTHPNADIAKLVAQGNVPEQIAHAALDNGGVDKAAREALLTNSRIKLRPQDLEGMINSDSSDMHVAAAENPNISIDQLRRMMEMPSIMDNSTASEKVRTALRGLDPDSGYEKVHVRFNTGKLRKIRDYILKNGTDDMKPNDIQKKIPLPGNINWNQMRAPNGNISASKIQSYIDAQPAKTYNWSTAHWNGAQMHNRRGGRQNVFQLNMTSDMARQIKDAGLHKYWKQISDDYVGNHPANEHTLGWVRHTGKPGEGIFIDEVQSDYMNSPHMKAASQAKHYYYKTNRGTDDKVAAEKADGAYKAAENRYGPESQHENLVKILFGDKHSNELLHEAFQQHLRDQGHHGTKIAVHSLQSKAKMNGWDEGGEPPVHGKIAYEQHPKKMGFEPGTYSKENMPTMSDNNYVPQGDPIWQDELRKYEKLKGLIKEMILLKLEKYDATSED